jgi:hypothetical protein
LDVFRRSLIKKVVESMGKDKGSKTASTPASKRKAKPAEEVAPAYYCQVLKPTIPDNEEQRERLRGISLRWVVGS